MLEISYFQVVLTKVEDMAACFIQAAWWRYQKRKQNKALQEAEDRLRDALSKAVGTSTTLGPLIMHRGLLPICYES